jgi:hypothetical protein
MEVGHPRDRLLVLLTQSCRSCLNMLVKNGHEERLTWGTSAALPTTAADSGAESFLEVDWPDSAVQVFGVDVKRSDAGRWYSLRLLQVGDRRDYERRQGQEPDGYFLQSMPSTTPASSGDASPHTTGIIQIYPASSLGRTYRVIYLDPHPAITKPTQQIYGFDGDAHEWIVWDTVIKVLFRDDEADPTQEAKALRERALAEDRLKTNVPRAQRGAIVPRRRGSGSRAYR